MHLMKKYLMLLLLSLFTVFCEHKEEPAVEGAKEEEVQTPVTVTAISNEPILDYAEMNATSTFLQSSIVKANVNGYIKAVNTTVGQYAGTGKVLFTLKTKEAESLGNTINQLDPDFHFTGVVNIKASQGGYITELDHQVGDYVQDG